MKKTAQAKVIFGLGTENWRTKMLNAIALIIVGVKLKSTAVLVLGIISTVGTVIFKFYEFLKDN